jgi:hypothetical protein
MKKNTSTRKFRRKPYRKLRLPLPPEDCTIRGSLDNYTGGIAIQPPFQFNLVQPEATTMRIDSIMIADPTIDLLFKSPRLNNNGIKRTEEIAAAFTECFRVLKTICPEGREFSIAKTKLQESSFFAKKSIANVKENQA